MLQMMKYFLPYSLSYGENYFNSLKNKSRKFFFFSVDLCQFDACKIRFRMFSVSTSLANVYRDLYKIHETVLDLRAT